mmetsp:Transcript_5861/g.16916  ORF Transcript_5861/g.16916 Transcript_5861/m.16916 type:complete len:290 (-) Transcript_5861:98-967(-)
MVLALLTLLAFALAAALATLATLAALALHLLDPLIPIVHAGQYARQTSHDALSIGLARQIRQHRTSVGQIRRPFGFAGRGGIELLLEIGHRGRRRFGQSPFVHRAVVVAVVVRGALGQRGQFLGTDVRVGCIRGGISRGGGGAVGGGGIAGIAVVPSRIGAPVVRIAVVPTGGVDAPSSASLSAPLAIPAAAPAPAPASASAALVVVAVPQTPRAALLGDHRRPHQFRRVFGPSDLLLRRDDDARSAPRIFRPDQHLLREGGRRGGGRVIGGAGGGVGVGSRRRLLGLR